jgi:hypothetical protein
MTPSRGKTGEIESVTTDRDSRVQRDAEPAPAVVPRRLTPAAERALAEAAARRAQRTVEEAGKPKEIHGRGGLDPVRFGDWGVKGLASDFCPIIYLTKALLSRILGRWAGKISHQP